MAVRAFQSPDNESLTGLLVDVVGMEAFAALLRSEEGVVAATEDGLKTIEALN